ncbi:MAG TPA: serine/threonine protein kinase, partial [Candidatus Choladousia intestinigallinarum]|nr:serine/threonine protein kinase [Candidatus Choladousia intestinigallinarum]
MKLCLGCMQEIEQQVTKCPYCGYLEGTGVEEPYYLAPGTVLRKRYLIGKVLGYGGFGITYIGYDQRLKRITAIKEYFPSDFATRAFGTRQVTVYSGMAVEQYQSGLERFHLEAQKLAKFTDVPEIVDIYDCFYENGTGYIVMEFLKGKNVKEILKEREKLPWEEAKEIILHVLDGLHVMHGAGMIHRDIAPDNIFITEEGQVKLLDFGAARYAASTYTRSLSVILKPGYAPEEQYRSRGKQGAWTDIYGVGASFYRM